MGEALFAVTVPAAMMVSDNIESLSKPSSAPEIILFMVPNSVGTGFETVSIKIKGPRRGTRKDE